MKIIYTLLILSLIFSGCSSKNVQSPLKTIEKSEDTAEDLAQFSDEFEEQEVYDPLNGYNRLMTGFNDSIYIYLLKPAVSSYRSAVHIKIRESIRNFFNNLYFPMRFVNNILQGKFLNSFQESERFVVNSTLGVAGLFDPALSYFEIDPHEEDFGQTLGFYGVGSGVHIVLPLLGPSNLRDAISLYPDSLLSFIDYENRSYWTLTDTTSEYIVARTVKEVNNLSFEMQKYDKMREDALDLYPYLRDVYEQYRKKQIEE